MKMMFTKKFLMACLLLSMASYIQAQTITTVSFTNQPIVTCGQTWVENNVTLSFGGSCSYAQDPGNVWLFPSDITADFSALSGTVTMVEVDVIDWCGNGCTSAQLLSGASVVGSQSNSTISSLETFTFSNTGSSNPDAVKLTSFEGQIFEIRITHGGGCSAPTNLSSTAGVSTALLSWPAVSGATSYTIQGGVVGSPGVVTLTTSGTSFSVSGLTSNTSYWWQVKADCGGSPSGFSSIDTFTTLNPIVCLPPDTVSSTTGGFGSVTLNWSTQPSATGYIIYGREIGSSAIASVSIASGATSSFSVSGLTGAEYEWAMVSVCGGQVSSFSGVDTFSFIALPKADLHGAKEGLSSFSMKLAPNPTNGSVNIKLNSMEDVPVVITVFNSIGAIVEQFQVAANRNILSVNLTDQAKGMYLIEARTATSVQTEKLILR